MNDSRCRISDHLLALRDLRGQLADLIIVAHRIIDHAAAMSDHVPPEHRAVITSALYEAVKAADRADGFVQDKINEQYKTPKPDERVFGSIATDGGKEGSQGSGSLSRRDRTS